MANTKRTLNDLFFKTNVGKRTYTTEYEIDEPLTIELFYQIMVETCNVCSELEFLDKERLTALYKKYVVFFNKEQGRFSESMKQVGSHKKIMSETIFGDMLPSTKATATVEYYKNRCYSKPEEMMHRRQNTISKESFIRRYGEDEGTVRFEKYVECRKALYAAKDDTFKRECKNRMRRISKNCKEHYIGKINPNTNKPYTDFEINEEISKVQTANSMISARKIKERNAKSHDVACRQVNYWMRKGYSYEESCEKVKQIQATNTIDRYVKKYGYEMGVSEYKKRNGKWGGKMRDLRLKSGNIGNSYSKAATKLFETVIDKLGEEGIVFERVYFGNDEFSKWDTECNRVYFYDFVINDIKLCVEYNGIRFHPKEGDYKWKCLFSGKSYDEVYSYDKRKQGLIQELGYELIVVWEDDIFEKSVDLIVEKCKKMLDYKQTKNE